jgi:hypothetical protein
MQGIEIIESSSEEHDINVEKMLKEYGKLYPQPLWSLVEDIQRQAMLYTNIIEQIKSGKTAEEVRLTFQNLGLLPGVTLPNPNIPALMQKAFDKVSTYRKALIDIVKNYGGPLLNELSFALESKVIVGVNIGFPPTVSIAVEHSAKTETVTRF